jgi:hypothetical protein
MLRALVDVSPVVHHAIARRLAGHFNRKWNLWQSPDNSLNELVEELELKVGVLRLGLERFKNEQPFASGAGKSARSTRQKRVLSHKYHG